MIWIIAFLYLAGYVVTVISMEDPFEMEEGNWINYIVALIWPLLPIIIGVMILIDKIKYRGVQ